MVPPFLMASDAFAADTFPADIASMNLVYHDKSVRFVSVVEEDKLDEAYEADEQDEIDEWDEPDALFDACAVLGEKREAGDGAWQ